MSPPTHPHATSKQTRLAKVGTGEDGRFLPAGNVTQCVACSNIVSRAVPMPSDSLGPEPRSPPSDDSLANKSNNPGGGEVAGSGLAPVLGGSSLWPGS